MLLNALTGAALCLLLIACANLANLLLARALARRRELAVRAALGAGRERLLRQMLTESLVLALLGGALGVLLAVWSAPLLARLVPHSLPIAELPPLDLRLLLFAGFVTLVTGMGFGVLPALRACGTTVAAGLHEGDRGGVGGRKQRLRAALVVAELVACVVLLVSSGLLIRALWRVQGADPGFRREGVLTLRTALPWPKYAKTAPRFQFYSRVLEGAKALPRVTHAAYISYLPMTIRGGIWGVKVPGRAPRPNESENASVRFVTPGFFAAMGIPLQQGRDVAESDTMEAAQIAVVSESFVRRYFPDKEPLGQQFEFSFLRMRTIAGVVGDVRVRGMERDSEPQVYIPYRQVQDGWFTYYTPKDLVVRTAGDPMTHAPALRQIIRSADPEQPVSDVRLLADIVSADTAPRQVQVSVLVAFAALAFLLAAIGIHGLLAFTVSQRTQEIGVRIALGAQSRDILGLVLRESLLLALVGVTLGAALAYAAGRSLEALLAGLTPYDPASFAAAIALAVVMTLAGSLLPAIRALRVDPTTALRIE
jgi:predicted permease